MASGTAALGGDAAQRRAPEPRARRSSLERAEPALRLARRRVHCRGRARETALGGGESAGFVRNWVENER